MPKLEYRSLVFEEEWVPEPEDEFFQVSPPLTIPPNPNPNRSLTPNPNPNPNPNLNPNPNPNPNPNQEAMVVNYPSPDVPFTRIVEYKHVPNQSEAVKVRSKYSHPY